MIVEGLLAAEGLSALRAHLRDQVRLAVVLLLLLLPLARPVVVVEELGVAPEVELQLAARALDDRVLLRVVL